MPPCRSGGKGFGPKRVAPFPRLDRRSRNPFYASARKRRKTDAAVLLHGWPATFLQMQRIFPILSHPESHGEDGVILPDAFDIIVPSLPGHGFSDRPSQSDVPSLALPISLPSLWPPRRSSGLIAGPSSCAGQICKKAGHFREWEEQQLLAKDIRTFFRLFRFR
jgi:pimeloyl-ACP methyl ester carboxylesterase